ncbi:sulfurtransferase complex subunit TusB [Algicola sagamiensis]|uniref:sulfurtransferase complex subunit TusB n=1 Tax=Algicola sagamiensis TaxID=163869 RepID=UPI00035C406F|nr:sulfurtransferase complex subunit TusB [Algicola sagamiensis]
MTTLHILTKPEQLDQHTPLLSYVTQQDAILLTQDAAYRANHSLRDLPTKQLFVLHDDAAARGIQPVSEIQCITYAQFVQLTFDFGNSLTW